MQSGPVVLVVGSLHHDIMIEADHLPRRDETAVGHRWYPKFGGKGGNQAVAAARAGVAVVMANGDPRLLEHADHVAPHHAEDGFAHAVDRLLDGSIPLPRPGALA